MLGWLVGCWLAGGLAGLRVCTFSAQLFVDSFTNIDAFSADRILGRMSHQKNAQKKIMFHIVQRWVGYLGWLAGWLPYHFLLTFSRKRAGAGPGLGAWPGAGPGLGLGPGLALGLGLGLGFHRFNEVSQQAYLIRNA